MVTHTLRMMSPGPCSGKGLVVSSITSTSPVLEKVTALIVAGNWDMVEQGWKASFQSKIYWGLYLSAKIEHSG